MSSGLCMPSSIVEGTVQLINVAVTNRKAVWIILRKIMKFGKEVAIDNKEICYSCAHCLTKCHPEIFVNTSGLMSFKLPTLITV